MAALSTTQPFSPAIPAPFRERMARLLGDEFPAFLASYDAAPSIGLRVNTLKVAPEVLRALAPFDLTPVPWCPAGFEILPESRDPSTSAVCAGRLREGSRDLGRQVAPGKHPYHAAGLYYLQDPSAMAVAELLDPQPGERVLDLAAAPGGKATHIASLMQGDGLLVANEIHPKRAWELAGNLERWGARNAAVTTETPERLAERFPGFFDRVLLDAPCSGEGMLRKSEAARREWGPELVRGCALRQTTILEQAARLVRPGGRLVYSTCTFNPEENEGTLARFLDAHSEFVVIEAPQRPGFSPGRPDWLRQASGTSRADLARAVRLWPHLASGEGHFVAVLRKDDVGAAAPGILRQAQDARSSYQIDVKLWRPAKLPRPVEAAYRDFCAAHLACAARLTSELATGRLALVGSYLYALPEDLPDLAGLRFLHPGWWLGAVKEERFGPSHALALGLTATDARLAITLTSESSETAAYLRGETLRSPGEPGWTLVTVDGFPLGWGKRVDGVIKSHYPRGLRRV